MPQQLKSVVIIGAGIGGLAAAARLAHSGCDVQVFDLNAGPGGKMRTLPSSAGPVDAGPTVLTLKPVFERLFCDLGQQIDDYVTLEREYILASHFWADGTMLELTSDLGENVQNIARVFGATASKEFLRFSNQCRTLFDAFDQPMMQSGAPSLLAQTATVARNPQLVPAMAPHQTLSKSLNRSFSEPRLAQLFARYATYVGGLPTQAPALLKLIWQAEAQGVWHVKGGMHCLAQAVEQLAKEAGAQFHYNAHVQEISGGPHPHVSVNGKVIVADAVLYNGDPRALSKGLLGQSVAKTLPNTATEPRSLSANVWAFAAKTKWRALSAHNVFFANDPNSEYDPLAKHQPQTDPTIYICAQDRFGSHQPNGLERFEIIVNAPAVADGTAPSPKEKTLCQTQVFNRLAEFGLEFSPKPDPTLALTQPADFAQAHPASTGSLYGRSPHGMMAAFKRPTARTRTKGLYLVGGGIHPGAGVPMATLSAQHAAEAILTDLGLTSGHHQADMRGGISMGSLTTARAPSP